MSTVYKSIPTSAKLQEIAETLTGYWKLDQWHFDDAIFDEFRPQRWTKYSRTIDFSSLLPGVKDEIKFFLVRRLQEHTMRLRTVMSYVDNSNRLADFLKRTYPGIGSLTNLELDKAMTRWRSYLIEQGLTVKKSNQTLLLQSHRFMVNFYDEREEFEKDTWDVRRIPGARYAQTVSSGLQLSFEDIPLHFRPYG